MNCPKPPESVSANRRPDGDLLWNLGDLVAENRRKLLVGQHADVFVDEVYRAVRKEKISTAGVIAAEIGSCVRAARGSR